MIQTSISLSYLPADLHSGLRYIGCWKQWIPSVLYRKQSAYHHCPTSCSHRFLGHKVTGFKNIPLQNLIQQYKHINLCYMSLLMAGISRNKGITIFRLITSTMWWNILISKTHKYIFLHQFPKSGKMRTFVKSMSSRSPFICTDKKLHTFH
jgi:hypothetical protein